MSGWNSHNTVNSTFDDVTFRSIPIVAINFSDPDRALLFFYCLNVAIFRCSVIITEIRSVLFQTDFTVYGNTISFEILFTSN